MSVRFSVFVFFFISLLLSACTSDDEQVIQDNPVGGFLGEWILVERITNDVSEPNPPLEYMTINDGSNLLDNKAFLKFETPSAQLLREYDFELFESRQQVEFWDNAIRFICDYEFQIDGTLALTDSFPNNQVIINVWSR